MPTDVRVIIMIEGLTALTCLQIHKTRPSRKKDSATPLLQFESAHARDTRRHVFGNLHMLLLMVETLHDLRKKTSYTKIIGILVV